ncbi:cytochrome c/c1 heme-lyase [Lanmaoa asiatica]|nr:cytochrome c/c1 heme-lyase [Lanmaoa asiatica]
MGQSLSSSSVSSAPASCPTQRPDRPPPSSGCPIQHSPSSKSSGCPIDHASTPLNPLNQMPSLPQTPLDNSDQLPTERSLSSIPRPVDAGRKETWEYPSPQQFYNALVRKGWETPVEHVETMVEIHNFLNERAWGEVLKWEKRVAQ